MTIILKADSVTKRFGGLVAVDGFSFELKEGAIDSIIGPGGLETERVQLGHRGQRELSLVGWRLEDQNGNVYVFPKVPELTLYGGGAVSVFTKEGVNSVVDLYWGLDM